MTRASISQSFGISSGLAGVWGAPGAASGAGLTVTLLPPTMLFCTSATAFTSGRVSGAMRQIITASMTANSICAKARKKAIANNSYAMSDLNNSLRL